MSRVKIELPDQWMFATEIPVRITDVNYGGHVGNDALVGILHEARVRWLKRQGLSEMIAPPVGLIMVDLAVRYKHEAAYGDVLTVRMGLSDLNERALEFTYQVVSNAGAEVARAQTGLVAFDYEAKKLARLPPAVQALLSRARGTSP